MELEEIIIQDEILYCPYCNSRECLCVETEFPKWDTIEDNDDYPIVNMLYHCISCDNAFYSIEKIATKLIGVKKYPECDPLQDGRHAIYPSKDPYFDLGKFKRKIRKRDNYTCQHPTCPGNNSSRALAVHHIDQNTNNNHHLNLISLCYFCHGSMHGLARKNPELFMEDYFYGITHSKTERFALIT